MALVPKLKEQWQTPCLAKLDALGWTPVAVVRSYGVDVALRTNDDDLFRKVHDHLPSDVCQSQVDEVDAIFSFIKGKRSGRVRSFNLVYHDHTRIARTHDIGEAIDAFSSWFRLVVGFLAPRHVFIHAGTVSYKGRVIIMPGRTMAGKSTLVQALVKQGARYMSDDYAVLEEDGTISPYDKPLSLRDADFRQMVRPFNDGEAVEKMPRPPGLIIFSQYEDGASWAPKPLAPGQALLGLLDNSLGARRVPEKTTCALKALTLNAPAFTVERGEAAEAASAILRMCNQPSFESE